MEAEGTRPLNPVEFNFYFDAIKKCKHFVKSKEGGFMSSMKTYEYIWLDGYTPEPNMRSKVKATEEDIAPDWSFDGSSTLQAEGGSSDCLLLLFKLIKIVMATIWL